jgi:hypothetical protein
LRNTSNPFLSTLPLTKKGDKKREIISSGKNIYLSKYNKQNANLYNKMIIPTLGVGKFVGKIYKRIFASKFYYTIL